MPDERSCPIPKVESAHTPQSAGATFSECKKYRYTLWRIWDDRPKVMCIGLNPSRANSTYNDPTIRILMRVLPNLGFGGFYMTNLFALISSNPHYLLTVKDPLGDNDTVLKETEKLCSEVLVCWGGFKLAKKRIQQVLPNYPKAKCFGINQDGSPLHPMGIMWGGMLDSPKLIPYVGQL